MLPFMFLSNDLTHCNRDGYGSMSNLLRASVSLALHYNLTYVHHPLRSLRNMKGSIFCSS